MTRQTAKKPSAAQANPTGDEEGQTPPESQENEQQNQETTDAPETEGVTGHTGPKSVSPPLDGRVLKEGEPFQVDGVEYNNVVIAQENVYREFYPGRSKRPSYVLLVAAGTPVPYAVLVQEKEREEREVAQAPVEEPESPEAEQQDDTEG